MSIMRFNFRSQILGHYIDVTIALPTDGMSYFSPENAPKGLHPSSLQPRPVYGTPGMKFQTVYLMHGGGDDDSLSFRYTNAELYAQRNYCMVVAPNIAHTFGAKACYGKDYVAFITDELPAVIQGLLPSSPKREDNFIIGYAMGGNAALGNAILRPDRYAACVDISGGIGYTPRTEAMIAELKAREEDENAHSLAKLIMNTFGPSDKFAGSANDIGYYARKYIAEGVELPRLIMACGSKEHIRKRVEADYEELVKIGAPVEYILAEGYDHDWVMWDTYVAKAMDEILPLKKAPVFPED